MELLFENNTLTLISEKKEIILREDTCTIDGMTIEMAGEYEKGGFLCYAFSLGVTLLYKFQIDGSVGAYLVGEKVEMTPDAYDFLSDIDILFVNGSPELKSHIEKIEPRVIVAFGPGASGVASLFGTTEAVSRYKIKESDFSADKTNCILMG